MPGKTTFTRSAMLFSPQNKVIEYSLILTFALTTKDFHMFIQKSTVYKNVKHEISIDNTLTERYICLH